MDVHSSNRTGIWGLLIVGAVIRALLIAWGEYQDAHMDVKYTDIDYTVFTDAARYVAQGGSPFDRSTYRYSPLLAYILLPNIHVTHTFGKVLFAVCDIIAGWQMYKLCEWQQQPRKRALIAVAAWLFNPFTVTISTRGSCDVLVVVLLLQVLLGLYNGALLLPAVLYGIAVHFRIYPIIYAPAIVFFIARRQSVLKAGGAAGRGGVLGASGGNGRLTVTGVLSAGLSFGLLSGGVFLGLNALFYHLYGHPFLNEAFLHHVSRKDPRHNFSLYFYHIYLTFSRPAAAAVGEGVLGVLGVLGDPGQLAFVPQLVLGLTLSAVFHAHLPFCWALQTIAFVAFNKVSTAQYFVWYFSLLPLVMPHIPWPVPPGLLGAIALWVLTQLHWLAWGYMLEFQGLPVYFWLWAAGGLFLLANTWLIVQLIAAHKPQSSFLKSSVQHAVATRTKQA